MPSVFLTGWQENWMLPWSEMGRKKWAITEKKLVKESKFVNINIPLIVNNIKVCSFSKAKDTRRKVLFLIYNE